MRFSAICGKKKIRRCWLAMLFLAGGFIIFPACADDGNQSSNSGGGHETDDAPLNMSKVAPIDDLIMRVQTKYKGSILNIKLESEDKSPIWRYEVKMLSSEGNVMKLEYDAETLELLNVKGKGHDKDDDKHEGRGSYWRKLINKFD